MQTPCPLQSLTWGLIPTPMRSSPEPNQESDLRQLSHAVAPQNRILIYCSPTSPISFTETAYPPNFHLKLPESFKKISYFPL